MGLHIAASALAGVLLFICTGGCIAFILVRWNRESTYSSTKLQEEET